MLAALYTGMSGLQTYSRGLQTISNNVANMNTTGFKSTVARFEDRYYGAPSDGLCWSQPNDPRFGSGVSYAQSYLNFAQGDLRASSGPLDLSISGTGFLTLLDEQSTRYARTGQFHANAAGQFIDETTGRQLALLDANGVVAGASISGHEWSASKATTTLTFNNNLSTGAPSHSIPNISVIDANGASHSLTVSFVPDQGVMPGRWRVTIADSSGRDLFEGSLQFFGGMPEPGMDRMDASLMMSDGSMLDLVLDFSNGVTAFSAGSTSTLSLSASDGYAAGSILTTSVNKAGELVLQYSNGQTAMLGRVALALFTDPQQLIQQEKGLFEAAAGIRPAFSTSGAAGTDHVVSGATEASNVDLSSEFGQLILIQRGFQASSQVVSAANEMLQQLFQLRGQS